MKFVKQDAGVIKQGEGLQGIYDIICEAASTCYKSTPRNGQEAESFINKLIENGHTAMLEFGTVYLKLPVKAVEDDDELMAWQYLWEGSPYVDYDCDGSFFYVTTNVRHMLDCKMWADNVLKYMVSPTSLHERRTVFRITTSIGTARELTRHRKFSFAQESTRYCNYGKDKFGNELTVIVPDKELWKGNQAYYDYINALDEIEKVYMQAINEGVPAQIAREVLPLSLKTEICMCGFISDWKHFLDLRYYETTGKVHPEMKALAKMIKHNLLSHD